MHGEVTVTMLDPAYSVSAIALRLEENWPFPVLTAAADGLIAKLIVENHRVQYTKEELSQYPYNTLRGILDVLGRIYSYRNQCDRHYSIFNG
jgi:hypothetical protein